MRALKIAAISLALSMASPGLAVAQEGFTAGTVAGALTGAVIGGPIGAAIGGLLGAAIGGAAEADHARLQPVRADAGFEVAETYPRQRGVETYPRRIARTYSRSRVARSQSPAARQLRLASALTVVERTCVRDRAGNQTCREIEKRRGLRDPSAAQTAPTRLRFSTSTVLSAAAKPARPAALVPERVGINTASADELNHLGGRFGRAIIARRPYGSVDELVSKRVLTRSAFSQIKDWVTAN